MDAVLPCVPVIAVYCVCVVLCFEQNEPIYAGSPFNARTNAEHGVDQGKNAPRARPEARCHTAYGMELSDTCVCMTAAWQLQRAVVCRKDPAKTRPFACTFHTYLGTHVHVLYVCVCIGNEMDRYLDRYIQISLCAEKCMRKGSRLPPQQPPKISTDTPRPRAAGALSVHSWPILPGTRPDESTERAPGRRALSDLLCVPSVVHAVNLSTSRAK